MGEAEIPLDGVQLRQFVTYVKAHLTGWLSGFARATVLGKDCLERRFKHQCELTAMRLEAMGKPFGHLTRGFQNLKK